MRNNNIKILKKLWECLIILLACALLIQMSGYSPL